MDKLFDISNLKPKKEIFIEEEVKYDLLKEEGGAIYLTRDGENCNVLITNEFKEHFFDMGDRGYLVNKAYELYQKLLLGCEDI